MPSLKLSHREPLRFTWMEFSGSLGDLGLFIPLVVVMSVAGGLPIGVILILAGVMNIITGWMFRQPIPVQPMKAIAAVVITEGLVQDEIIAAGLLMGILLLMFSGIMNSLSKYVPKYIVRGIQLGIGLKLAMKGVEMINILPMIGWNSIIMAVLIASLLIFALSSRQPVLLYIFLIGFVLLYLEKPSVYSALRFSLPEFKFYWPSISAWSPALFRGVIPQLPLTLLNSVVALCALSAQYFPGRAVEPKKVAVSIGIMNLINAPLGGIPLCHGAGGLAAQYRFGARTGGSVVILGFLKVFVGVFLGGALIVLLRNYPLAVLGPMLILAGIELAKSARDCLDGVKSLMIVITTAVVIIAANTWVGFLVGCLAAFILKFSRGDENEK